MKTFRDKCLDIVLMFGDKMLSHFANAAGKFDVERETSVLAQRSC